MIIPLKTVVYDKRVQRWCLLPYPKHPKGCPMYGKRDICPPNSPFFPDIVEPPFFLVLKEFDLEAQEKRMKERHPEWSKKMCRNPRYWQKTLMKEIMQEAQDFIKDNDGVIVRIPEATGVNLFATCKEHGIILERNPQKFVRKMVIIGTT